MRRAAAVVLVVALLVTVVAPPADACLECVALGLASFAVFTQLVSAVAGPRVVYTTPAYYPWYGGYPAAYAAPSASYYPSYYSAAYRPAYPAGTAAAWTGSRVVQYPHGRYELRGDGVSVPYVWVWIPSATPPVMRYDGPEGGGARTP
jgi:hypothetical protein